jgi:hypothetical protein
MCRLQIDWVGNGSNIFVQLMLGISRSHIQTVAPLAFPPRRNAYVVAPDAALEIQNCRCATTFRDPMSRLQGGGFPPSLKGTLRKSRLIGVPLAVVGALTAVVASAWIRRPEQG